MPSGTEPGEVDADRDQAFACVQRAQCFAVEQRIAAAEADLRQTRPLAHQNWKRTRADLGVKRAMIRRGGSRLSQIRFRRGNALLVGETLRALHARERLVAVGVDLSGVGPDGMAGYRAKRHSG